ncbi:MAG TPA: MarR family transcriptional regulator [Labilithrix sp.]|jgi:DNA-binding MarR family transcriptional regulator
MTPARKEPKLEPALSFLRELWALNHALESTSKRMYDRMGITAQQRMVLRFVGKFPHVSGGELAAMLHVEKSTLSLALKRLEERGFIARKRDRTDARKAHVVLTARGRRFDVPTVGTVERAVERALHATRQRDVDAIREFLQLLVRTLEESR